MNGVTNKTPLVEKQNKKNRKINLQIKKQYELIKNRTLIREHKESNKEMK